MGKPIARVERRGDELQFVLLKRQRDVLDKAARAMAALAQLSKNEFYLLLASHLDKVRLKHSPPARPAKPVGTDVRVRQLPSSDGC